MQKYNPFLIRKEYFGGFIYDRKLGKTCCFLKPWEYDLLVNNIYTLAKHEGISSEDIQKSKAKWEKAGVLIDGVLNADIITPLPVLGNFLTAPIITYLHVTFRCNLECDHCMFGNMTDYCNEMTKQEIVERILDPLQTIGSAGIRITGGEPTVREDIFDIIQLAKERGMHVTMNTNGVFNNSIREKLLDSCIDGLVISLDGDRAIHEQQRGKGTFKEVIDTLLFFSENSKIALCINATISKKNMHLDKYFVDMALKYNANLTFNPLRPFGRNKGNYADLLSREQYKDFSKSVDVLRKKCKEKININNYNQRVPMPYGASEKAPYPFDRSTCAAAAYGMGILPNGEGNVCGYFSEIDEFRCKSILTHSLIDLWNSPEFMKFRKPLGEPCCSCDKYKNSCIGLCKAMSYAETGKLRNTDRYCFSDIMNPMSLS